VKYDTSWVRVGEDVDFPSDDFTTIAEDKNGKLILGTNKGISIYDGTTFTNIPKVESLNLNKFRVNQICIDKNNVAWMATEAYGVLRYDGTNWAQYSLKTTGALYDKISAIKMASNGKLYVYSEPSMGNTFDVDMPTQDADELLRRDITRRIKQAEPKQLLAVIQM
jgi:ligand-binding sensor domain-containing protein